MVLQYQRQPMPSTVETFSGAGWAGCREARRSTAGGCVKIGAHSVKGRGKTVLGFLVVGGGSGFCASLTAAAETLGILSMLKDQGWRRHGEVWGDANAALGVINRNGLGKTRHIDTGLLWIQQMAAEQRLKLARCLELMTQQTCSPST